MKQTVWLGGLALWLTSWVSSLPGQEIWRPQAPVPISLDKSQWMPVPRAADNQGGSAVELGPPVPASLGRPVALPEPSSQNVAPVNGQFPDLLPLNFPPPGPPEQKSSAPPVAVAQPIPTATADEPSDFGLDRVTAVSRPPIKPDSAVVPASAATSTPAPDAVPLNTTADPDAILLPPRVPILYSHQTVPPDVDPLNPHWFAGAEYLMWATKHDTAPPLVTTSDPADAGRLLPGSTTQILYGNDISQDLHEGARFDAGYWLDMWHSEAIELEGFFLGQTNASFNANSNQYPVLARPFFGVNSNAPISEIITTPGISTGSVHVSAPSDLWDVEALMRCCVCSTCNFHFDFLAGPRIMYLGEGLEVDENIHGLPTAPAPFANEQINAYDRFATDNYFIGLEVGGEARWQYGPWSLLAKGKLGIGGDYEEVNIEGAQRFLNLETGAVKNFQGGLLALPSNLGTHRTGDFAFVPEIELQAGYQVTDHIRVFVGYDFLYWSSVLRPGEQIDRSLDETLIPNFTTNTPPAAHEQPAVLLKQSDFWAQGLTAGFELHY